jgi:hypothetical protein
MTIRLAQLEMPMILIARLKEELALQAEFLDMLQAYFEHVRWGGDPSEMRRDRWVKVDDVKKRYRGKDKP